MRIVPWLPVLLVASVLAIVPVAMKNAMATADGAAADKVKKTEFARRLVTILARDDRGEPLRMPQTMFFDDRAGELYLLNGDNRLVVYGPDYFPQESLGKGRGLDFPVAGCVDAQGNLHIPQAATAGHPPRVTVLNPAFLPLREIPLTDMGGVVDFSPHRIALGKEGRRYITGLETAKVLVLDADGGFEKWFTVTIDQAGAYLPAADTRTARLAMIKNVAVDALGNLFLLSEETSKVYVFDPHLRYLFTFGTKGGSQGKLSRPRALAIDERKRCFYVCDYMRHSVLIFDFNGTFRYEFGGRGWGPEWFNYPVDILVGRQGEVIVADFFNQRVQVFDVSLPPLPERTPELWSAQIKDTQ